MCETPLLAELMMIADELNRTIKDSNARVLYDLFADALYWTDELPRGSGPEPLGYSCLRPILRHRTSLIAHEGDERFLDIWTKATSLFPKWVGFSPERLRESETLRAYLQEARTESAKAMDEAFDWPSPWASLLENRTEIEQNGD